MPAVGPTGLDPLVTLGSVGPLVVLVVTLVVAVLAIAIEFEILRAAIGGDDPSRDARRNCSTCGARVSASVDSCPHCGAAFEEL